MRAQPQDSSGGSLSLNQRSSRFRFWLARRLVYPARPTPTAVIQESGHPQGSWVKDARGLRVRQGSGCGSTHTLNGISPWGSAPHLGPSALASQMAVTTT